MPSYAPADSSGSRGRLDWPGDGAWTRISDDYGQRFPWRMYASLGATVNFIVRAPRQFAEVLGKLLFWCGEDKIIYGSETPIWHPRWALRAFWEFEIPQDLVDGYGYPQLTEQA